MTAILSEATPASSAVRRRGHATIDQMSIEIADPRSYCSPTGPAQATLIALAEASLAAATSSRADEIDAALVGALAHICVDDASGPRMFSAAPSAAVAERPVAEADRRMAGGFRAAGRSTRGDGLRTSGRHRRRCNVGRCAGSRGHASRRAR
jgi:hypothetical protein